MKELTQDDIFLILRDQDSGDCRLIKENLLKKCRAANKPETIVRIACHELESFYLGDLAAVEKGLGLGNLSKRQRKHTYRQPDRLANPAQELMRLTQNRYQKVAGSRAIGQHLDPENNQSHSFKVLVRALKQLSTTVNPPIRY